MVDDGETGVTQKGGREVPGGRPLSLLVIGDGILASHPLPDSGTVTLGRSRVCDVEIDHPSISRRHAVIHIGPPLEIEDLDSANGTRIGENPAPPLARVPIRHGEVIDLGSVMVIVQQGSALAPGVQLDVGLAHERLQAGDPDAREAGVAPTANRSSAARIANLVPVVLGRSMAELQRLVERIAAGNISILILGETGVGKEVLAERVHTLSPRRGKPFLRLNCAALSESLLESELFGHEKGSFTGAVQAKAGLLETADGGTVFLDEIGELPMTIQVKLLRVLEERMVTRVGGLKPRRIDVRFVAATNRDPESDVQRGHFRQDLYFRLAGVTLTIPPLRERIEEIPALAKAFIAETCRDLAVSVEPRLSAAALSLMEQHPWPGNIRELRNVIERAVLLSQADKADRDGAPEIRVDHLPVDKMRSPRAVTGGPGNHEDRAAPEPVPSDPPRTAPVDDEAPIDRVKRQMWELERQQVIDALNRCAGNQTRAARILGISRRTLHKRLDAYGLPRPRKK